MLLELFLEDNDHALLYRYYCLVNFDFRLCVVVAALVVFLLFLILAAAGPEPEEDERIRATGFVSFDFEMGAEGTTTF